MSKRKPIWWAISGESLPLRLNTAKPRQAQEETTFRRHLASDDWRLPVPTRAGGNFCDSFCNESKSLDSFGTIWNEVQG